MSLTASQIRHRKLKADSEKIPKMELQIAEIKERISVVQNALLQLNHSIHKRVRDDDCMEIYDKLSIFGSNNKWKH